MSASSTATTALSAVGTVMATSLSDAQLGCVITVIPTSLGVRRIMILRDFVAYGRVSWKLWVDGGQNASKVPTITTSNFQQQLVSDTIVLQDTGQKAKTPVKVAIPGIAMSTDGRDATVPYYVDMTQVIYVDARDKSVTEPSNKAYIPAKDTMMPGNSGH